MTATNLLGWCASRADLRRACDELSEFLALRRRRAPSLAETLLGLWVDPRWSECSSCEFPWREPGSESGTARIRESAGVDGIWMLCWLEVPATARCVSRHALLMSLSARSEPALADPPPAFVPVFPLDAPARDVRAELQRLSAEHAALVLAPWYQETSTGRLRTAASRRNLGRHDLAATMRRNASRRRHH